MSIPEFLSDLFKAQKQSHVLTEYYLKAWEATQHMVDFAKIRSESQPIQQYLQQSMEQPNGKSWTNEYNNAASILHEEDASKLAAKLEERNAWLLIYSAYWCGDCRRNVGRLALLAELSHNKIDAYVRGGIKTAPLDPNSKWAIPPSPPELEQLDIQKIPAILVISENKELGRIIENPETDLITDLLKILSQYLSKVPTS